MKTLKSDPEGKNRTMENKQQWIQAPVVPVLMEICFINLQMTETIGDSKKVTSSKSRKDDNKSERR